MRMPKKLGLFRLRDLGPQGPVILEFMFLMEKQPLFSGEMGPAALLHMCSSSDSKQSSLQECVHV